MSVTTFLAVYAAILSSIGLGWNLYRDLLDRARLKVSARIRRLVRSTDGKWYAVAPNLEVAGASEQIYVVVDVTSIGRRPIQWTGWGAKRKQPVNGKDHLAIIPAGLPKMLKEGETHSEFTPEMNDEIGNIKRLFIWDGTGKQWYVPRRMLKKLKQDAQTYLP